MNSIVSEKQWIQSKIGIPYENLSQSYLRAETQLTTNTTIPFTLQANKKSSPIVTERLLQLNDQFVLTHIFVGLKVIGSNTPSELQQQSATVYTWENPNVFTTGSNVNAPALYNGSLRFNIDRRDFIPEFPVRAFRRVPDTQSGAYLVTAGTTGTPAATFTGNSGFDAFSNGLYGFYPVDVTLIDGRQTIELEVDLGASTAFNADGTSIYAVFEARGYLVVNAKS